MASHTPPELPQSEPSKDGEDPSGGNGAAYPAGWYANAEWSGERYWDGALWTHQYRDPPGPDAGDAGSRPLSHHPPGWHTNAEWSGERHWDGAVWTHRYRDPPGDQTNVRTEPRRWYLQRWVQALGGIGLLVVAFVAMTIYWLAVATEVPSVIGLTRAQAEAKVKAAGLSLRAEGHRGRGGEKVCEQDPQAGSEDIEVTIRFGLACENARRAADRLVAKERKRIADEATARAADLAKQRKEREKAVQDQPQLAIHFSEKQDAAAQEVLQRMQWVQSRFGTIMLSCAALAELRDSGAKTCFRRGGRFTDTDTEFRATQDAGLTYFTEVGRQVAGDCQAPLLDYVKGFSPYATAAAGVQLAGANADKRRFVRNSERVTRLSALRRRQVMTMGRACHAPGARPFDTSAALPRTDELGLQVDVREPLLDASRRCIDRLRKEISANVTCGAIHGVLTCLKDTGTPGEINACLTSGDLGGAARSEKQFKDFSDCIDRLGAGRAPPKPCDVPD